MVQVLVSKNKEMRERAASTKSINLRQATMTQEFDRVADGAASIEPLPKGWMRIWDNPGGRYYFYNTLDKDIHVDEASMHAKIALTAWKESTLPNENEETDDDVPDAVGSASRNVIISPSPTIKSEFAKSNRSKTHMPTTYGGTVCLLSSEEEENKRADNEKKIKSDLLDTSSSLGSSTDLGRDQKPAPVYKKLVMRKRKKAGKRTKLRNYKKQKMSPVASMPREQSDSSVGGSQSDESVSLVGSVLTQDLPNTEDFGGAEALVTLQTEPAYFEEEDGDKDDMQD